jgi:hypothetical protein
MITFSELFDNLSHEVNYTSPSAELVNIYVTSLSHSVCKVICGNHNLLFRMIICTRMYWGLVVFDSTFISFCYIQQKSKKLKNLLFILTSWSIHCSVYRIFWQPQNLLLDVFGVLVTVAWLVSNSMPFGNSTTPGLSTVQPTELYVVSR